MDRGLNILLILLIILLVILYFVIDIFVPKIELVGKNNIDLVVGNKYIEPGYCAYHKFKDIKSDVVIKSNLNENEVGTYYINYYVKYGVLNIKRRRVINVIDNVKPNLEIDMNNNNYYVCPGKKLKEVRFRANDNYDGDITDKVKIRISNSKVIFVVKDKNNNRSKVVKDIYYVDLKAPKIDLIGEDMTIIKGDKYNELGAKASDNCDGDLTNNIIISGSVNNNKEGEYELNYLVSDDSNNMASVKRKVKVIDAKNGLIYLTFDDGPRNGTTDVILDILKEENVKATFFVTGNGDDSLIKREFVEGHSVALHSSSHDYSRIYSSEDNYFADLKLVSDRVLRITGKESKIMRFPGGSSNTVSRKYSLGIMTRLTDKVHSMGYHYFDWNVNSGDATNMFDTPEDIYNNVVSNIKPGRDNIVLMHDIKPYTRDAIRNIIHWGKDNGYKFVPIDMSTHEYHQSVNN